jgi:hypothetical protein
METPHGKTHSENGEVFFFIDESESLGSLVNQLSFSHARGKPRGRCRRRGGMPQFRIISPGLNAVSKNKFAQRIRTPSPNSVRDGAAAGGFAAGISFSRPPPVNLQRSSFSPISSSESLSELTDRARTHSGEATLTSPVARRSSRASSPSFGTPVRVRRFTPVQPQQIKGHARAKRTFSSTKGGLTLLIAMTLVAIITVGYGVAVASDYARQLRAKDHRLSAGELGIADGRNAAALERAQTAPLARVLAAGDADRIVDISAGAPTPAAEGAEKPTAALPAAGALPSTAAVGAAPAVAAAAPAASPAPPRH